MNNSVIGKSMETRGERVDIELVWASEDDKLRHMITSYTFSQQKPFVRLPFV